jgi:CDP-2,3-bis-(O-geranylgeranyl)-sn-glycerol synthase
LETSHISIISIIIAVISAFWIMLPAYVPNPVAAACGGGTPIDSGRNWTDGKRIFGDGKTYRGFFSGVLAGILIGILMIWIREVMGWDILPEQTLLSVFLLSVGALLGDLVKSFFKRRLGKERGAKWPVADQYDFVAGAFILVFIFDHAWFMETITIPVLIVILIVTPLLHRAVNIIGYIAGVKEVPW